MDLTNGKYYFVTNLMIKLKFMLSLIFLMNYIGLIVRVRDLFRSYMFAVWFYWLIMRRRDEYT